MQQTNPRHLTPHEARLITDFLVMVLFLILVLIVQKWWLLFVLLPLFREQPKTIVNNTTIEQDNGVFE